jgi:hypothetical protein
VDVAIGRSYLQCIASVAQDFGFGYQAAAGIALEKLAANLPN